MKKELYEILQKKGLRPGPERTLGMRLEAKLIESGIDHLPGIQQASLDRNSTFQPETREDLEPKEEDYIYPVYRALSQTTMECHCIDVRRPGVLEASVPMLIGQTVYTDHNWNVEGWIGAVQDAWWDDPEQSGSGLPVPGINARFKIDWKANPKIARGILMVPPALHSVSATFWFEWQPSHPDMDEQDFWYMLGEEVDGRQVLVEVTKIVAYDEISLVYQGADIDAKIITQEKEAESENTAALLSKHEPQDGGEQMKELLEKLQKTLSVDTEEAALTKALELAAVPPIDPAVLEAAKQIEKMGLSIQDAPALAATGVAYRERLTGDIERFAGLALCNEGEKLPEGFVEAQTKGDIKQLESSVEIYRKMAEKKLPLTCQKCGSHDIAGRSSVEKKPGEGDADQKKPALDLSHLHA